MTKLIPYDPNDEPGSGKPKDDRSTTEQVHYHYYDQRTFVQDRQSRIPESDDEDEDDGEEVQEPLLAAWQKKAFNLIAVAALIGLAVYFLPAATTVTTNTVETNVADDYPAAPAGPQTTRDMIMAGNGNACSQGDVRETIARILRPKDAGTSGTDSMDALADIQTSAADVQEAQDQLTFSLDAIALAGSDAAISSVSCDANLTISNGSESRDFSISYAIRPSIENDASFVVSTAAPGAAEGAKELFGAAVRRVLTDRLSREQPETAPSPASTPRPDASPTASPTLDANGPRPEN